MAQRLSGCRAGAARCRRGCRDGRDVYGFGAGVPAGPRAARTANAPHGRAGASAGKRCFVPVVLVVWRRKQLLLLRPDPPRASRRPPAAGAAQSGWRALPAASRAPVRKPAADQCMHALPRASSPTAPPQAPPYRAECTGKHHERVAPLGQPVLSAAPLAAPGAHGVGLGWVGLAGQRMIGPLLFELRLTVGPAGRTRLGGRRFR